MKGPMRNRFTILSCLFISSLALIMLGLTFSLLLPQTSSAGEWGNIVALTGSLALCLMLFLLFRTHLQNLTEMAQRSQALAEKIAEHKRAEETLAERTARLEAVRDVAVEITRAHIPHPFSRIRSILRDDQEANVRRGYTPSI